MRLRVLAFALLIPVAQAGSAQVQLEEPPLERRLVVREGSHRAEVVFHVRPFHPENHIIRAVQGGLVIDRHYALGTDGDLPKNEISKIEFTFDGKRVPIESRWFADCFEPNLASENLAARMSDHGAGVFVFMKGSDAAGSYEVIWAFQKDGKHSRWSGSCPDCDLLNLSYFSERPY